MEEVTGRLEAWHTDNVFPTIIWGYIYGDSKRRFTDGARIHTSHVITSVEQWKDGAFITTLNSTYLLGKHI